MIQVTNVIAKVDFTNRTVEFDGDVRLEVLPLLQDAFKAWENWRLVVTKPTLTWGIWCNQCGKPHSEATFCDRG